MSRARRAVAVLTAGVLVAGCSGDEGGGASTPVVDDGPDATTEASGDPGTAESARDDEPTDPEATDAELTEAEATEEAAAPVATNDFGRVGANGPALLSDDVPGVVVEIDFEERLPPDPDAVEHLVEVLEEVLDKPVRLDGGNAFSLDDRQWRTDDLRRLAADQRETASSEEEVSVYLLYVRGSFFRGPTVTTQLAAAYNASEAGVMPEQWRGPVRDVVADPEAVEKALLVHEVGHLLGLVGLTGVDVAGREDPEHPGHSSNEGSVMFHAVESTAVTPRYDSQPPALFDADDLADLEAIRDGG